MNKLSSSDTLQLPSVVIFIYYISLFAVSGVYRAPWEGANTVDELLGSDSDRSDNPRPHKAGRPDSASQYPRSYDLHIEHGKTIAPLQRTSQFPASEDLRTAPPAPSSQLSNLSSPGTCPSASGGSRQAISFELPPLPPSSSSLPPSVTAAGDVIAWNWARAVATSESDGLPPNILPPGLRPDPNAVASQALDWIANSELFCRFVAIGLAVFSE